VQTHVIGFICK